MTGQALPDRIVALRDGVVIKSYTAGQFGRRYMKKMSPAVDGDTNLPRAAVSDKSNN